jgi:hypothetical protein
MWLVSSPPVAGRWMRIFEVSLDILLPLDLKGLMGEDFG